MTTTTTNGASIPIMITAAQRQKLAALGHTETQINAMTPSEAHAIFAEYDTPAVHTNGSGPPAPLSKLDIIERIRANFPKELQELNQWVTWRMGERDGKPTKFPYNVNGLRESLAETDAPQTWTSFKRAINAYQNGNYDGVGFVFSEDDPYAGVDFDKCIVDEVMEPQRAEWMERLDSYSEYSPSETGAHTFVIGKLPPGRRKSAEQRVEMYDEVRFFTVTGDHVPGTPQKIFERDAQLKALHAEIFPKKDKPVRPTTPAQSSQNAIPSDDQVLLNRMFASKNGAAIRKLWDGDTTGHKDDASSADQALCNHLAFWTGKDAQRMDRMFRQSGLMRDKWDRNARSGETYGEGTISRAIDGTTDIYKPSDTEAVQAAQSLVTPPNVPVNGHTAATATQPAKVAPDEAPPDYATVPLGDDIHDAPPLPDWARLTDEDINEAATTGQLVIEYVKFARQASPMTPDAFHVASGLSAISIAIARRLHVAVSTMKTYPNLYTLYIGPSTTQRKTTGMKVLTGWMNAAQMLPTFSLAARQTPEAFAEDLSLSVPRTLAGWTKQAQEVWLKRRALAAQRGWLLDEASHLLDSFNRDYSAGLLPMVLDLFESNDQGAERNTKSGGLEIVENAYLTVFGATTYAALSDHMSKAVHWNNGLFARFNLVCSDSTNAWQFWPAPMEYPASLVRGLHRIAFGLFGDIPQSAMIETEVEESGKKVTQMVLDVEPLPDNTAVITDGAWAAWERYARAMHEMLLVSESDNSVDTNLHANYGRFGTTLIKVAMCLAVCDADQLPVTIERRHVLAAQGIVETWRNNLHKVRSEGRVSEGVTDAEGALAILAKNGTNWTSRRDLMRASKRAWKDDLEVIIQNLEAAGQIERQEYRPAKGPKAEQYRVVV